MAQAIRALPGQPKPSESVVPGLLDGLDNIHRKVARWLEAERRAPDNVAALPGARQRRVFGVIKSDTPMQGVAGGAA